MKRLTGVLQRGLGPVLITALVGIATSWAQGPMFMQDDRLRYEENRGQIVDTRKQPRPDILYTVDGSGLRFFLRRTGTSHVFYRWSIDDRRNVSGGHGYFGTRTPVGARLTSYRLDMELIGANVNPQVVADYPSADVANFYRGRGRGVEGVRRYGRVTLVGVYPGVDMIYHVDGDALKYDLVVQPGANPGNIRMQYFGADTVLRGEGGAIEVRTPYGTVIEEAPEVYQVLDDGTRVPIDARYRLSGREIRFEVAPYDPARPLVIDPVLRWSTLLGGSGTDVADDITCHPDHDTAFTVVGSTSSVDFPTTPGVAQVSKTPSRGAYPTADAFVARFNVSGQRLWITYLGGGEEDGAAVVGLDEAANAYIAGFTASSDFPLYGNALQSTPEPGASFIAKLDLGGRLVWSTYFHGASITAIAVAPNRDVAVGGSAWSSLAITPGAFQPTAPRSGESKGFVARLDGDGALRWSSFLGGTPIIGQRDAETVTALAFNRSNELFACGWTMLADFPTTLGAFQSTIGRSDDRNDPELNKRDGWLAKLDVNGSPIWATFCGGSRRDMLEDMALDPVGNPVIVGSSRSLDFPTTAGAFSSVRDAIDSVANDGVIAKFNNNGSMIWGTYFGGYGPDEAREVAIGRNGDCWIGFSAASATFPITQDAYTKPNGSELGGGIVKLDPSGQLLWATGLSGTNNATLPRGICVNRQGCIVCGVSGQNFFTTPGAFQRDYSGGAWDAMMMMFCDFSLSVEPRGRIYVCAGDSVELSAPLGFDWYRWSNGATTRTIRVRESGNYLVTGARGDCAGSASEAVSVTVLPPPERKLKTVGSPTFCTGDSVVLYTDAGIRSYRWNTGDTSRYLVVRSSGSYSLRFTDVNGCTSSTDTMQVTVRQRPTAAVQVFGATTICEGGATTLDAGPGYAGYLWSTGETRQNIKVTRSGYYTVRVLEPDGCWSEPSAPKAIQVNPRPKITIRSLLPTQFCEGDSTVLMASTPAGLGARYEWSNGTIGPRAVIRKGGSYSVRVVDTLGCTSEASVQIGVAPRPQVRINAGGPTRFCVGDSIVLSVGPHAMVQWSTGDDRPTIVAKHPGKYFAMAADQEGCAGISDTIIIETVPRPFVQISGPASVCKQGRATYSVAATPGVEYGWEVEGAGGTIVSGANSPTVTVQWGDGGRGNVKLLAQHLASGCDADTTISVAIGTGLIPIVAANRSLTLCQGDSVMLDAGVYASYQWSNGARTRTITVRNPGTYTVAVADAGGCFGSSLPVVVRAAQVANPVIDVPNNGRFCSGDSIVLDAGAGYRSYLWSNGYTSQRIVVRSGGSYDVLVVDSNGCSWHAPAVAVTPIVSPSMEIVGPRSLCAGSTVEYITDDQAGSSYIWNAAGGTIISGQGSSRVRVQWPGLGEGLISVMQRTAEGCDEAAEPLAVYVGDSLEPAVSPSGQVMLCEGEGVTLDAGDGYANYEWSNGARTRTIVVKAPGTYSVQVSNAGGCRGTSRTVDVVGAQPPQPRLSHTGTVGICDGDSLVLRASGTFAALEWSTGERSESIVIRRAGRYALAAINEAGCTGASDTVEVQVFAPPASPTVIVERNHFIAPEASGYQWYRDGMAIDGATARTFLATKGGEYHVMIANEAGCSTASTPFRYSLAAPRLVVFDTVTSNVGERARLGMRVVPGLDEDDAVRGYRAVLHFDPAALFIHDIVSPDGGITGEPATYRLRSRGELVVERPDAGRNLVGDRLFEIEYEGLISGRPVNFVVLDSLRFYGDVEAVRGADGIVILIGCEVGTSLARPVRIVRLQPNPSKGYAQLEYRAPEGSIPEMRLIDAVGHQVLRQELHPGTGAEERVQLVFGTIPSGLYWLELTVAGERSSIPIVVTQ